MEKKLPMPNALFGPSDGATIPLHPRGDGVSRNLQWPPTSRAKIRNLNDSCAIYQQYFR